MIKPTKDQIWRINMDKNKKKRLVYEMWFCYVDNNNKIQNALADVNYSINSRERFKQAMSDLNRITNGNFRSIVNYQILKKKYIASEKES